LGKSKSQDQTVSFQKGVYLTGSAAVVNIFALFLETMIAARVLEAGSYGTYVLLVAVVNFLVMAIDLGFKTAITQMVASNSANRRQTLVNSIIVFRMLIITALAILLWAGTNLFLKLESIQGIRHFIFYIPLMIMVLSFDELSAAMLQGFRMFNFMAVAQSARSIVRLCLTATFLLVLKWGMISLILSWIISYSITAVYQYLHLPIRKKLEFNREVLKEILKFGFPLQTSRFLWFVTGRVDVLLLGMFAGVNSVAYYDVATKIPFALNRLYDSFTSVFYPNITALLANGSRQKARRMLEESLRLLTAALGLPGIIAVLFGGEIMTLLFSEKYAASGPAFAIMMVAIQVGITVYLMGYTLTAAGFPGRSLIENSSRTVITILLNLVFIPLWGFVGSAVVKLVANLTSCPLSVWLLRKSNFPVSLSTFVKPTAILLSFAALVWFLQPVNFMLKVTLFTGFLISNYIFTTIRLNDVKLILPGFAIKRMGLEPENE